jgi:hypothetical protein
MRRNVRRLNREVGSLNSGPGSSKRKAPGAGSKASKRAKEVAAVEDPAITEYDDLALQMMTHGSSVCIPSSSIGAFNCCNCLCLNFL